MRELFSIERQVKNQINIIVPELNCDQNLAHVLQKLLIKKKLIVRVDIDLKKKALEIEFDEKEISKESLLKQLNVVLKSFTQAKRFKCNVFEEIGVDVAKQSFEFEIQGMSCSSCALFIEMALNCHPGIDDIKIDYDSNRGSITGQIEWVEIVKLIEEKGYHASMIEKSA